MVVNRPPLTVREEIEKIALEARRDCTRLSTGHRPLDKALGGGFGVGMLTTVASRPAGGKTTMAGVFSASAAQEGYDVVYASTEMTKSRLVAAGIASYHGGHLTQDKAFEALGDPSGINLLQKELDEYLDQVGSRMHYLTGAVGVAGVESAVKALQAAGRRVAVVVDYVQGLKPVSEPTYRYDRAELALSVDRLRRLAVDRHVPVICLSSVSRAHYARPDSLDCIAECSLIEQCSATVISIEPGKGGGKAVLHILKNRFGTTSKVQVEFDFAHSRFREADEPRAL